ncbi:UNVERIFIED_CONTAM: SDR family oxidoreductase [Prevotella sp. 15_C9]
MKDSMTAQIPMKRFGQADEIATAAAFLAQQEYMTGQVLAIDGGISMV